MAHASQVIVVLALALPSPGFANPKCAKILARAYSGYTEGVVHMIWSTLTEPGRSDPPGVLADALDDAATPRTIAQAASIRLALDLEAQGNSAFASDVTPARQWEELARTPRGAALLELWQRAGWRLSPTRTNCGFGLVVRNGVPRVLHVPSEIEVPFHRDETILALLARFPTVDSLGGDPYPIALERFAFAACCGHPRAVVAVERETRPTCSPAQRNLIFVGVFNYWREQPEGFGGPSGVSWVFTNALERMPSGGACFAAWIRGEPARDEE